MRNVTLLLSLLSRVSIRARAAGDFKPVPTAKKRGGAESGRSLETANRVFRVIAPAREGHVRARTLVTHMYVRALM